MIFDKTHIETIESYPLIKALDTIRTEGAADTCSQDLVVKVLLALVDSDAAAFLHDTSGLPAIDVELNNIRIGIQKKVVDYTKCQQLVQRVFDKSNDCQIWQTAFKLADTLLPRPSPLASYRNSFRATLIESDLEHNAYHQLSDQDEAELRRSFRQCTFRNVQGFCKKYFRQHTSHPGHSKLLQNILKRHNKGNWIDLSAQPDHNALHQWVTTLTKDFLTGLANPFWTDDRTCTNVAQRYFFAMCPSSEPPLLPSYEDVLVVGLLKDAQSLKHFDTNFLQLASVVRNVFTDQPLRFFVHAFVLCGPVVEFWVFDRSGSFSSGAFDIHAQPRKFATALLAYASMPSKDMGLNLSVQEEASSRFIMLGEDAQSEKRFNLVKAMVRKKDIVSRATTCYGTEKDDVVKFSWLSDQQSDEVELLKHVQQNNVRGIPRLIAHRRLATIDELRSGLTFPPAHIFREPRVDYCDEDKIILLLRPAVASTQRKRAMSSGSSKSHSRKHQKLARTTLSGTQTSTALTSPPQAVQVKPADWRNKVYTCFVTSPAGRLINSFETPLELLEAMRDAIRAHQSLHNSGILHRDVSPNNILITDPARADGLKGMLIDLDSATKVVDQDGPPIGTWPYMAINVLLGEEQQTYRHDLESFFYVLLELCTRQAWFNGFGGQQSWPEDFCVEVWWRGSESHKAGQLLMFESMLDQIPDVLHVVKPLCRQFRTILFGNDMRLHTPANAPDVLYAEVLQAFETAIGSLVSPCDDTI